MSKRIFITGINGQDGYYLSKYMLSLGHEVHGIIRRNSVAENEASRIKDITKDLHLYYGDMTDSHSLENALKKVKPDYVFHLAAQSHVGISFTMPDYTMEVNSKGTFYLLRACKRNCPKAHIYNAATSEMFGASIDHDGFQRENTPMNPVSPYGTSKLDAYNYIKLYRKLNDMYVANGICFNHESPKRGSAFVTQKVVKAAVAIHRKQQDKLELGNLDSFRDWGHAKDYVEAMWLISNHIKPMDFVIATGITHSIRDMCKVVFDYLGLNYEDYVVQNPEFMRPKEVSYLKGDAFKARIILGWKPKYTFESLLHEMIESHIKEND